MSLGLEAAGFDVIGSVEIDPVHALVHEVNFPYGATLCQDIAKVTKADLFDAIKSKTKGHDIPEIDVMAGGPPCQGFSMMGKRNLEDPRNRLVFEYVRLLREIQPKYFIFENVQGLGSGQHKAFLTELLSKLQSVGYEVLEPRIMDAASYGVPQHRKRLILLGYRKDVPPIDYPEPTHGESLKGLKKFVTVHQAIADLSSQPIFTDIDTGLAPLKSQTQFVKTLNYEFRHCHRRIVDRERLWGHLGSNHRADIQARFQQAPAGKKEPISRLFKLDAQGLANTLRAGTPCNKGSFTAPRPIHYSQHRCISIREAARLHTFPDWFQLHRKVWHGFREIGNAVAPLLAKAIGDRLMTALEINPDDLKPLQLSAQNEQWLNYTATQAGAYWGLPPEAIAKRQRRHPTQKLSPD